MMDLDKIRITSASTLCTQQSENSEAKTQNSRFAKQYDATKSINSQKVKHHYITSKENVFESNKLENNIIGKRI